MLKHLTDAQKAEFEAILRDPSKRSELSELADEDAAERPWWSADASASKGKQRAQPTPIAANQLLKVSTGETLRLEHNLLAIMCVVPTTCEYIWLIKMQTGLRI